MVRKVMGLLILVVTVFFWVGVKNASAEMRLVVSDEFKTEMSIKAFAPNFIASDEPMVVYLKKDNITPGIATGVLVSYFRDIGLDESYTSLEIKTPNEVMAVAPLLNRAAIYAVFQEAHETHCRKDKDAGVKNAFDMMAPKMDIIKSMHVAYMKGKGVSYLRNITAMRDSKKTAETLSEVFDMLTRNDIHEPGLKSPLHHHPYSPAR